MPAANDAGSAGISRRSALSWLAASAVGVPLTGCGEDRPGWAGGFSTGHGRAADSGHLALRNIVAVSAIRGVGTLLTTIFNGSNVDDALLAVSVRDGHTTLSPAVIPIPGRGDAVIGLDTSLAEQPGTVILRGTPIRAGYIVWVTFTFQRAAPVEVGSLVMAHDGVYQQVPLPNDR